MFPRGLLGFVLRRTKPKRPRETSMFPRGLLGLVLRRTKPKRPRSQLVRTWSPEVNLPPGNMFPPRRQRARQDNRCLPGGRGRGDLVGSPQGKNHANSLPRSRGVRQLAANRSGRLPKSAGRLPNKNEICRQLAGRKSESGQAAGRLREPPASCRQLPSSCRQKV